MGNCIIYKNPSTNSINYACPDLDGSQILINNAARCVEYGCEQGLEKLQNYI